MRNIPEVEFYEITPEFNSEGRLCNYGSGAEEKVKVPAAEWERFNQLAGRQHEIIDGVVVFNDELAPCLPDTPDRSASAEETLAGLIFELVDKGVI